MRIMYPRHPLQPLAPDDLVAEEYAGAQAAGWAVSLFSFDDFLAGRLRVRPAPVDGDQVLYRGWMMTPVQYAALAAGLASLGAALITSPAQYTRCHHLPGWYAQLADTTPETCLFGADEDVASRLRERGWDSCFVKDYVKSLGTEPGSLVRDLAQLPAVIALLRQYRGELEGGLCVRRIEDLLSDTEERYFVWRGTPAARNGRVPEVVQRAAACIDSPFFTVDTCQRRDGVTRIVELGDGQVSDRKQWTVPQLLAVWRAP